MTALIPVIAAPLLDPSSGRVDIQLPEGLTIAEIVAIALPGLGASQLDRTRVVLVSEKGRAVVSSELWAQVRPKPGVQVVIRVVPGKNAVRSVLRIIVAIAAVAIGFYFAGALGFTGIAGSLVASAVGMGVTALGNLLINALVPPPKPKNAQQQARDSERSPTYTISGWQNRLEPNGVLPDVLGKVRYAPPFAAGSYTEIVGDVQYVRALFTFGYGGPFGLSIPTGSMRIGETALGDYDEFSVETREGVVGDAPLTLYNRQVVEEQIGVELVRPLPRDDAGRVIKDQPGKLTPVIRYGGPDATGGSIILGFPGGLGTVNDQGEERNVTVWFRIRYRKEGWPSDLWWYENQIAITASKFEAFYRQYSWTYPERGRYAVEVIRLTDEHVSARTQSRSSWLALQTIRPEYPLVPAAPLALVALRVKATYQLNGALETFNALPSRRCLDWDAASNNWVVRETSNPASLFRAVLQGPANPKPVPDSSVDFAGLQAWHAYCTAKGLKYDRVLDDDRTFFETLTEIAAAGRATPRHDGRKWSVVVDRPQSRVIDHISPRNSAQIRVTRGYFNPPDGFRVSFLDASNDYKPAERIIPWPGHSGEIKLTEALEMPGKTDPAEIYVEARRRMHEALYRPDTYTAIQDGTARVATRGDLVMASFDVLERLSVAARVKSVSGRLVELDEAVTMEAGGSYALRFRVFSGPGDVIGDSIVLRVNTVPGTYRAVVIGETGGVPVEGQIVHFGPVSTESRPLIITGVEAGRNESSVFRLVDAAPIIDELTDEERAPAWTGRVGNEVGDARTAPPAPRIVLVRTGLNGTGQAGGLEVQLVPGSGPVVTARYRLEYRLVGAANWTALEFAVSNGGQLVTGFKTNDPVQIKAAAISPSGVRGGYTSVVTVSIGNDDAPLPKAIDPSTVSIGALLGGATIMFSTGDDTAVKQVQLYRSRTASLDRANDAIGEAINVSPSRGYSIQDGDTTRENLLFNGGFDSGASWTAGAGWSISGGAAKHSAGSASSISQPISLSAGRFYRIAYTVAGITAGSVSARLEGGVSQNGAEKAGNGPVSDRIQATDNSTGFALAASTGFVGSVDGAVLFAETETCLAAGTHYYWLVTLNADGVAGPVSGPFPVVIR